MYRKRESYSNIHSHNGCGRTHCDSTTDNSSVSGGGSHSDNCYHRKSTNTKIDTSILHGTWKWDKWENEGGCCVIHDCWTTTQSSLNELIGCDSTTTNQIDRKYCLP